jgi:integrase
MQSRNRFLNEYENSCIINRLLELNSPDRTLGFGGASSHSGRRTFLTKAARRCIEAGGSLRDVQQLAGHSTLSMTQKYIEGSSEAKRKLVNLI